MLTVSQDLNNNGSDQDDKAAIVLSLKASSNQGEQFLGECYWANMQKDTV
jgi:hypothetical protein